MNEINKKYVHLIVIHSDSESGEIRRIIDGTLDEQISQNLLRHYKHAYPFYNLSVLHLKLTGGLKRLKEEMIDDYSIQIGDRQYEIQERIEKAKTDLQELRDLLGYSYAECAIETLIAKYEDELEFLETLKGEQIL